VPSKWGHVGTSDVSLETISYTLSWWSRQIMVPCTYRAVAEHFVI
jgi:hypothetical protein